MILLMLASEVNAQSSQLLINENFESYTNGNLNGQNGWTATGNSDRVQVANSSPLTYPGYASGSKYVNVTRRGDYFAGSFPFFTYNTPDDPYKSFIGSTSLSPGTATTFFMSFLVMVPNTTGTVDDGNARPTVALRTSSGNNIANFYIADNGGPGVRFGIKKDESTDAVYASGTYGINTTYLVVIRYDLRTSNAFDDRMYLWINPSLTSQPTTASANVTITSGSDDVSGSINSIQFLQENNSATASLDAFKVSYARGFADNPAAAWDALNPTAAPLPVTFGEIKGYNKEGGIQVDWTVHTEINVSHYEIERSIDGVSFNKIGSVTAQARDGVLHYTYFDAMVAAGVSFYRVRNVDMDGKYSYSAIVKVSGAKSVSERMTIYPNPVQNGRVNFQTGNLVKGIYSIEIFNATGQQVYNKMIKHSGGMAIHSIQLPATIKAGIYHIQLKGDVVKEVKQFLIP